MLEGTSRPSAPVQVDELQPGDRLVFLGAIVEVLDVDGHRDFPAALQVMLRRAPEGKPATTLLPKAMVLMGVYLPRQFERRCPGCGRSTVVPANVARGVPERALCGVCSRSVDEPTDLLPAATRGVGI